ncbi:MAG: hypothetical protein SWY16_23595 [Cyanobacteriota bacterium]|nr:hypothetical protein [Cyanobacteriota bacterium]
MKTFKPFPTATSSTSATKSWWAIGIGLALVLLGIGIGLTSTLSTLTCNRVETNRIACSMIEEDLLEFNVRQTMLDKLETAEVRIRVSAQGEIEKLVLVGEKTELKLNAFDGDAPEAAEKINEFVGDLNRESVTLTQDDRWFSSFFGLVLAIAGLFQTGLFKFKNPHNLRLNNTNNFD